MLDLESQEVHTLSLATSNLRELQFNVRRAFFLQFNLITIFVVGSQHLKGS